jgi:hypothetical protein
MGHHLLFYQIQINPLHRLRERQSKTVLVQPGVFHGVVDQSESLDSASVLHWGFINENP